MQRERVCRTFCKSYLTTEEDPVQQSLLKGSIAADSSHCCGDATPRFRKKAIRLLLAVAEGESEMVKAACCPSFSLNWSDCADDVPSRMTASCAAPGFSACAKRGAGLLPNLAM